MKVCPLHTSWFFLLTISYGAILFAVIFYELSWIHSEYSVEVFEQPTFAGPTNCNACKPNYVVFGSDIDSGYLKHVLEMFDAFGFVRGKPNTEGWDILWAHDYPFRVMKSQLTNLKNHQKVNHFPGSGFITNKMDLAKTDSLYIPKAFEMPKQKEAFLKYVTENPKKMFVQKSNDHRGIKIEKTENFNLNTEGIFIQEFVNNPLLVDGHKFDIGVYTIITSIEPLRVYIYNGDILFRFCPDKYYPFDPRNKNKYVIGDDYLPLWKVPSLEKYFVDLDYSMRTSFDTYMRSQKRDPNNIWNKIEDAIRDIVLLKEKSMLHLLKNYKSKRNFFELIRFDFAVDEDFNVYVMEANMSPNLSSAHFPLNRLLYYQVLFNLFSLVGISDYTRPFKENKVVSRKNLMVFPELCASDQCTSCYLSECQVCSKCLSQEALDYLTDSYAEHNRKNDCKRIFPPSIFDVQRNNSTVDYSPDNLLLYTWFKGKCILDESWC